MAVDLTAPPRLVAEGPVMGSTAAIAAPDSIARQAFVRLRELEARWSRFLPTSDISMLNQAGGRPVHISSDSITLLESAARAWLVTDGAFDPTMLGTLASLGYDRSRDEPRRQSEIPADATSRSDPTKILVDRETSSAALPPGTVIDPGGIGKGLAADLIAEEFCDEARSILVEIGGDLRVAGEPPAGGWQVDVWNPDRIEPIHRIAIESGGVASSSTLLRRWTRAEGDSAHHIIDPRTLIPSATGVVACTVIAGTAAWAEAFTKVPFSRPIRTALDQYEHHGLAALIISDDGAQHTTSSWKDFLR